MDQPVTPPVNDPRPHWARMTPDGGPTYPDDPDIIRWRAAAFAKGKRYAEENAEHGDQARAVGMFAEGGG